MNGEKVNYVLLGMVLALLAAMAYVVVGRIIEQGGLGKPFPEPIRRHGEGGR